MGFFKVKHKALLFDDNGEFLDIQGFKRSDDYFTYGSGKDARKFNIILNNCTTWEKRHLIRGNKRYYYYNINNPNPILLDKKSEPIISSKIYNVMLETKVARDLNDLAGGGLAQYFTFRNIVIGLIVIGVIIYFASGGSLTHPPQSAPTP